MREPHRPAAPPVDPPGVGAAPAEQRTRIARQITDERVAMVYALTPTPVLAGMAFALLVVVIMWPYRPPELLLGWLMAKLAVGVPRVLDTHRFRRARAAGDAVGSWQRRSLVLLVMDALVWGAMGVLFMPVEAPGLRAVMFASMIGIAGVGVFSYASDARGCVLFLLCLLLPTATHQAMRGTAEGWFASLGIAIYLAMMSFEARRSERRVIEMLRLRFENAWIAEQRQHAMLLSQHASAAKSRFLATVSHEMRTPLNGILGMTQMLQRSPLNDEQRAQLDIIQGSSRHLQSVIGDLLDLSRIEFGKLSLEERPFALADTVREVTGLLQAVAEDKGLRFELRIASDVPEWLVGDASRVKQVLHNLVGNAIKFTAHGKVLVDVARDGAMLRLCVRDSGEGVAPDMLDRIFDAFEQGPDAVAAARVGTGLGLTISRRLARAMGGDVICEPPGGRGASFVFTMPCRAAQAAPRPAASHEQPLPQGLRGRVLVVDDNAVNALVASAMLKRIGLEVCVAEDGLAALERMRAGDIDLVLMDCQLPMLDGWEATRRFRRSEPAGSHLPIVALTANAVLGDRERCLDAGMDDYLAKPVEFDQLVAAVTRGLHVRQLQRAG
ncbi:two-component system, sensor histidine kinase [Burkholderiaceae bacterium]|nr:two-component system, sensor histidine kinase [Burkholderiaceae bacterium]